jgi:hypothetical protein
MSFLAAFVDGARKQEQIGAWDQSMPGTVALRHRTGTNAMLEVAAAIRASRSKRNDRRKRRPHASRALLVFLPTARGHAATPALEPRLISFPAPAERAMLA